MQNTPINNIVETIMHKDGVYEIIVHGFDSNNIGLYEDGIRKALKAICENREACIYFNFSSWCGLQDLNDRALFDIFQFISFNCLKHKTVRVNWGQCLFEYLEKYDSQKTAWKLSSLTVKKLIEAGRDELSGA